MCYLRPRDSLRGPRVENEVRLRAPVLQKKTRHSRVKASPERQSGQRSKRRHNRIHGCDGATQSNAERGTPRGSDTVVSSNQSRPAVENSSNERTCCCGFFSLPGTRPAPAACAASSCVCISGSAATCVRNRSSLSARHGSTRSSGTAEVSKQASKQNTSWDAQTQKQARTMSGSTEAARLDGKVGKE